MKNLPILGLMLLVGYIAGHFFIPFVGLCRMRWPQTKRRIRELFASLFLLSIMLPWSLWLTSSQYPTPQLIGTYPQRALCEHARAELNAIATDPRTKVGALRDPAGQEAKNLTVRFFCVLEGVDPRRY